MGLRAESQQIRRCRPALNEEGAGRALLRRVTVGEFLVPLGSKGASRATQSCDSVSLIGA